MQRLQSLAGGTRASDMRHQADASPGERLGLRCQLFDVPPGDALRCHQQGTPSKQLHLRLSDWDHSHWVAKTHGLVGEVFSPLFDRCGQCAASVWDVGEVAYAVCP